MTIGPAISVYNFNNTDELLNLRTLKISTSDKYGFFQCMGKIFCVQFSKVPFEIPHKIFYPYV